MSERRRDPGWIRRWWPIFTVLLALLVVVGFGGPETVAVVDPGAGGSYTESLRWLGTEDGGTSPVFWAVTGVLVTTGLTVGVYLPVHLVRGWPWEKRRPRAR
jgi:hypothetical protein